MRMIPLMGVIKNAREKSKITAAVSGDSLRVINFFFLLLIMRRRLISHIRCLNLGTRLQ